VQRRWGEMTTVTVSYGHGLSVTPLALTAAIGGMLNDGVYVTPTVRKHSVASPAVGRRVFRSEVSQDMVDMMRTYGYATAGWNAAPVAGDVIRRIGPILPGARDMSQYAQIQSPVTP